MVKEFEDKSALSSSKEKKPSGLKGLRKYLVMFTLFFVLGVLVQHFTVEPLMNPQLYDQIAQLKKDKTLLNTENSACLTEKGQMQDQFQLCQTQVNSCTQDRLKVQEDLTNCQLK